MKKRNNAFARLVGLLLVSATVLTLTVAATGGAGTSSGPLVTLSYFFQIPEFKYLICCHLI